jgi:hypothetical protein
MKPETIEHPCIICSLPSRSCGHSKQDRRAHTERVLAERRKRNVGCAPGTAWADTGRRRSTDTPRHRKVPAAGSGVFPLDEGHSHVGVPVSGRILRARMSETKPVRHISPEEYGTA